MIELQRVTSWRTRLDSIIEGHRHYPFAWGSHDCAYLAFDAVLAMTGVDLMEPYRGKYKSQEEAEVLLKSRGFVSHIDELATLVPAVSPSKLQTGDLAVIDTQLTDLPGEALGIVTGSRITALGFNGVGSVSLRRAVRGFKIG